VRAFPDVDDPMTRIPADWLARDLRSPTPVNHQLGAILFQCPGHGSIAESWMPLH